ncbi:MAG: RluA family pseudouridine synthase [Lachnospiraceae bacterium]|jgi:pseudouridine synthase, RluA family|nr:RluA family pseudouridine synthase [Lachnospiraceae bacterium]
MQLLVISAQEAGQRLDRFLEKYMSQAPKSFFYKMMRKKNITLNGRKAEGKERLSAGDEIRLFLSEETIDKFRKALEGPPVAAGRKTLDIVYEDNDVLVVNKPQGMLSQKAQKSDVSLTEYITEYVMAPEDRLRSVFRPGVCNRLDRNTTGLVVAGKTVTGLQCFNRLFRERELQKYYLCLVKGTVTEKSEIHGYLIKDEAHNTVKVCESEKEGSMPIATAYEPLGHAVWKGQEYTLLNVHLITGKSHQIRAHLQSIGHPVAGDAKYGDKSTYRLFKEEFGVKYQLLHAWKLCLQKASYLPGKYYGVTWTAPLPEQFQQVLKAMGIGLP